MQFYFKIHVSVLEKTKTKDEIKFKTHLWQPSWERIRDDMIYFVEGQWLYWIWHTNTSILSCCENEKISKELKCYFICECRFYFCFLKKNYQNKSVKRTCLQSVYILINIHQNSESYVHSTADLQNINISYFLRWQRKSNYKN